ncbi:MAG: hypothetical protein MJY78_01530, partial [Fibrobacter sp.]|nr:hypothetical protein [Fibrobacter sp.]
ELKCFAQLVNSGATSIKGRLTADICLNACGEGESVLKADGTLNGNGSNFTQWIPIGTAEKPYKGIFDGMGAEGNAHVISGLYFNDGNVEYVGLFKYNEGMVQNVGVVDSYIKGGTSVGGVVGYNRRTVSNVYNTGAVSGNVLVGGVVGSNVGGIISNVYNTGAVSGGDNVGGVVGRNEDGTVSNVYNTGAVSGNVFVGGVVGHNTYGTISDVYNTGAVSGGDNVGGVVGCNEGKGDFSLVYISSVYYNTDFYTGNAIGKNGGSIENVDGITTAELIAIDLGPEWVAGNLAYDKTTGKLTASFPYLENPADFQYKITALEFKVVGNVIQIANADDLKDFARLVNEFGVTDVDAELTADICLNACGEGERVLNDDGTLNVADTSKFIKWTPIGTDANPYIGTFDGQGHTVSGLYFNNDEMSNVGFFGAVGSDGETKGVVKNVGVVDSYFEGNFFVGGVVGLVMENASVNAVFNTGAVSGQVNVGGVVGVNGGGFVTNVYNTGSVSGEIEDVGGVIGLNVGEARNVYSVCPVSGKFAVGGVVGLNEGGNVANAYYNSEVFEGDSIGGGNGTSENVEGKNSADLVAGATLKLDTTVWVVGAVSENAKQDTLYYPYLKVFGPHEYVLGDVKKYAITVAVNDKTMGTVTGAGEYEYGADVEIKAVANEGYKFTDWEDDVKASAERTIVVTGNITYTANFEAIPSSSSEVESSSSAVESSSSVDESSSSEAVSSSSEAKSSSSEAKSSSSDAESSSSEAASSSSEAKSSSSEAKSSSSSAKSSSSSAKSSSSEAKSSSSEAKSSSSEAKSSSSDAKSSSSEAKSSSSSAKSSSSSAKSSSSEAKSSSSEAKSSSSQKESIIAQAQLPQFSVTASGKMVSIAGARPNSIVNVFDMQGNMVKTVVATSANFTFALPSAGVYIVKNGYTAKRVNVR